MTISTNGGGGGNGNRIALRLTLPTLGAISSIMGVIVFITGFAFGYLTFKADMTEIANRVKDLQAQSGSIGTRLNTLSESTANDRSNITNRITGMETDIKYITQGITDLRRAVVPQR